MNRQTRWKKASAGIRHLRDFNASRDAGFVAAVSARALIMLGAVDESLADDGMSPQHFDCDPWEDDWNPRYNVAPTRQILHQDSNIMNATAKFLWERVEHPTQNVQF